MWIERMRRAKNRKGMTLVEMLAAITITAILAVVLSMMIVPVMNSYSLNRTRTELAQAVTARLNDIAMYMRGATGIYLASNARSFPDIKNSGQYAAIRQREAKYGFAMDNYYEQIGSGNANYTPGYLYPEFKFANYSDVDNPVIDWASSIGKKLNSDDYQYPEISCPNENDFWLIPRKNADNGNSVTVLELHLKVKKVDVTYEGQKTVVCDNLVVLGYQINTAAFTYNSTAKAYLPGNVTVDKQYHSVWFSLRD